MQRIKGKQLILMTAAWVIGAVGTSGALQFSTPKSREMSDKKSKEEYSC